MSWLDKIKSELSIQTGDGQTYKPSWLNAGKSIEYNLTEFEFPEVRGTLAFRTQPKGARYSLELYFQGDNHLDVASNFEISARDPRAWTLSHPFYGRLSVQPLSLQIDNSQYNVSKLTIPVIETINDVFPKGSQDPLAAIQTSVAQTNQTQATNFAKITPPAATINYLNLDTIRAYNNMVKFAGQSIINQVVNQYYQALGLIEEAATAPYEAIAAQQSLLMMPASFALSAQQRFQILKTQYDGQRNSFANIVSSEDKVSYETLLGTTLAAFALASATPQANDYDYRISAINASESLLAYWNQYISDITSFQTDNNGAPNSYIPSYDSLFQLQGLVNYSISNLLNIALDGKQERIFELEKDSNWVVLAHRLYGIDEANANVTTLIKNNNAGLKEMLNVEKGRMIKYYV